MSRFSSKDYKRMMNMLAYLYWYPGWEGKGGKARDPIAMDEYWPGTRLRAPGCILHGEGQTMRNRLFKGLQDAGLIEVYGHTDTAKSPKYQVTQKGEDLLFERKERGIWYTSFYKFVGTGKVWKTRHFVYHDPEVFRNWYNRVSINMQGSNSGVGELSILYWPTEQGGYNPPRRREIQNA